MQNLSSRTVMNVDSCYCLQETGFRICTQINKYRQILFGIKSGFSYSYPVDQE